MSNFQKDVQLLADLQGLIEKREKQVNPPEGSTAIMGAISPVLRAAMPAAQKAAQRELDILVRVKNRLGELMEGQRSAPAGSTVSATWSAGSRSWRPSLLLRCSSTPRETAGRTTFWKPCGARRKPTPTPTSG